MAEMRSYQLRNIDYERFFNHLFEFTFLSRVANYKRTSFNTSCFRSFISHMRNNSLSFYLFSFALCFFLFPSLFSLSVYVPRFLYDFKNFFSLTFLYFSFSFFHSKICLWWISSHLSNPRYTIVKSPQQ